ncbi:hypothetical protein [Nocardia wallacei]|uniref:hypothetical protein n=1 Tax=Nocardia wallacei TaxID=480035 RepID=UPI0024541B8A|nr:hypothetical protein [Nocardia wallacei]
MSSQFPLPHTVGHRVHSVVGEDSHGSEIDGWADPVPVAAFWWSPSSTEPAIAGHDRVLVDVVMVVDSATVVGPHDRFVIGGSEYDVIGPPQDYDHGPWWSPGCKPVNLQRVEG